MKVSGSSTDLNSKSKHLITDAGFSSKYITSLAVIVAVGLLGKHAVATNVQSKIVLQEMYDTVQWELIDAAESLSLWFLMGLFSSSCCLIQIGLNALSFGCAGFNTWLGPIRPALLAVTVAVQSYTWWLVLHYKWRKG